MKIKDKIFQAIDIMENDELLLIYDQIQLIRHLKQITQPIKTKLSIEDILEMTSTSQECWSNTVIEERRDRT